MTKRAPAFLIVPWVLGTLSGIALVLVTHAAWPVAAVFGLCMVYAWAVALTLAGGLIGWLRGRRDLHRIR